MGAAYPDNRLFGLEKCAFFTSRVQITPNTQTATDREINQHKGTKKNKKTHYSKKLKGNK